MTLHLCFIGCDIAKQHLDLFDEAHGESLRIANTTAAIEDWLARLDDLAARVTGRGPGEPVKSGPSA